MSSHPLSISGIDRVGLSLRRSLQRGGWWRAGWGVSRFFSFELRLEIILEFWIDGFLSAIKVGPFLEFRMLFFV